MQELPWPWPRAKEKTLSVKIPAGVDTGDRVRLAGEGHAGPPGTPSGDLFVEMMVREHKIFSREGNDLYCEVPIRFSLAALGGDVVIPTLEGDARIKVPTETQTGKLFACAARASSRCAAMITATCCVASWSRRRCA